MFEPAVVAVGVILAPICRVQDNTFPPSMRELFCDRKKFLAACLTIAGRDCWPLNPMLFPYGFEYCHIFEQLS